MATDKKSGFINVDELIPQVSLEQAARHYGVELPSLAAVGTETRSKCFLLCGRAEETGDRVLAMQLSHPAKQWHCHQYGCGKGGNFVSLLDLMKSADNAGGKPRGARFKEIAGDLKAMAAGAPPAAAAASPPAKLAVPATPKVNVPLKDSENERARGLTELDKKFVVDVASMPPAASAYLRRRPFLSPEVLTKWRAGYLPRDTGGDHSGGTMRGKFVYPYLSQIGDVLTWFGRDCEYEAKHGEWERAGKTDREPEKFHFVKGYHRGIELWNQHGIRRTEAAERLKALGLVVVEGPNDVIRMDTLGVPAVALCSNTITREQAARVARIAQDIAGRIATVLLDCDPEGENGMRQCLGYLAQLTPVRLAWTSKMYGGKFKGRQPESLTLDEWKEIESYLLTGKAEGWSLE